MPPRVMETGGTVGDWPAGVRLVEALEVGDLGAAG